MAPSTDLEARARAWRDDDPDPTTRAELSALLEAGDRRALAARFTRPLAFGTAGIRGPLGAGPARMNRALARRVAHGLAFHLRATDLRSAQAHGVVVGCDARHLSATLAEDVAAVVAGSGLPAYLLPGAVPTPVLAFAVRHLGCAAGVMVTASHNPSTDNGLKVYGNDGRQIVAPTDAVIAAGVAAAGPAVTLPLGDPRRLGAEVLDAYVDAAATAALPARGDAPVVLVHTALHGVATAPLQALFRRSGLPAPRSVSSQAAPDPDFPTVAYPDPEEAGALDLALAEAAAVGADGVLAHDPDGDRLALAVPERGGWRVLTGDELGVLLAEHVLSHTSGSDRLVVSTVVSSTLLGRIAAEHGVHHASTLPGFKWVMRAAADRPGTRFVFGYEEALGYAVGDLVGDKDGLTAAVAVARMISGLAVRGGTVLDRLESLARRHGLHATASWSIRTGGETGAQGPGEAAQALTARPPTSLAGRAVTAVAQPAPGIVLLHLDGGARVAVRPSGTEAKLKCYVQVVVPHVGAGDRGWSTAQAEAAETLGRLRTAITATLGLEPATAQ